MFYLQKFFGNYKSFVLRIFESFCNAGKAKIPATSCMQIGRVFSGGFLLYY